VDLSIVIVSFNARLDLERCLASLSGNPPVVAHEIVVVDNGSTDGSPAAVRHWPAVQLIELADNRGFAAATNVGIRATSGTNLLLLNSDTVVPPGALDALVAELWSRTDTAVVGPRLIDGAGRAELSFGRMLSPLNELRRRRLVHAYKRHEAAASQRIEEMTHQEQWPDWVSGACLLVRRSDAEAVGLLDERYFMYTEDVDFCAAIRARGRRIFFTPAVEIVHLRGRSVLSAPDATRAAYRRSHLAFYEKHHPALAPLLRIYRRFRG
jgi:GT2 family glycosyltransferase